MSGTVNKAIIIGFVGTDPEIKSFEGGGRKATFSVATNERWKDKAGARQERTDWHQIAVFNDRLVEIVERYVKKGSKVYVEGQMSSRTYEKAGETRYIHEIVLRPFRGEITLLDSQNGDGGRSGGDLNDYGKAKGRSPDAPRQADPDDDIPF